MSEFEIQSKCIAAISGIYLIFSVIMYVDDSDLLLLGDEDDEYDDILRKTQALANKWSNKLWSLGSALRPEKCFWFPILFEWDECGNYRYQVIDDSEEQLLLPDHTKTPRTIRRFQANYGKDEILGINLAPDGNNHHQYENTEKAISKWIQILQPKFLTRSSAKLAFMSTIVAKIRSILESSNFTKDECDQLQKPLYKMILPKMGINNHIPTVFRYAPRSLQGCELPNLYTDQGIYQITHFLRHIGEDTQDGKMIVINIEAAQIHIGTSIPFLHLPYPDYEYMLPDCWTKTLWEFVWRNGITLVGPIKTPSLCRHSDQNIIEQIVTKYPNINHNEMNIFNNCRLYLQVHSLADITTGDGTRITGNALQGMRDDDRKSTLTWPAQRRPADKYWKIWRRMLRQVFTNNTYWSLNRPLGSWTTKSHQEHKWFCNENSEILYYKQNINSYRVYKREEGPRLRSSNKYYFHTWTDNIPTYFEKTTIRRTQNGRIRAEGSTPTLQIQDDNDITTFTSFIKKQPNWIYELLQTIECPEDLLPIRNALQNGTLEAVADGSYKKSIGMATAAWIITTPDSSTECLGALQVPGDFFLVTVACKT